MPIEWKADFETGIDTIDADHRDLVGLVNLLESCLNNPKRDPGPILLALRGYVHTHFAREEALFMHDPLYSQEDREKHLAQHATFRAEVQRLDAHYRSDPASLNLAALHAFLRDWLTRHILRSDKDFAAHILK